jgi:hypothetical protein
VLTNIEIISPLVLKKDRKQSYWIQPLNYKRLNMSQLHLLYGKLHKHSDKFFSFYRMSVKSFDELVSLVCDHIRTEGNCRRDCTGSEERFTMKLW